MDHVQIQHCLNDDQWSFEFRNIEDSLKRLVYLLVLNSPIHSISHLYAQTNGMNDTFDLIRSFVFVYLGYNFNQIEELNNIHKN